MILFSCNSNKEHIPIKKDVKQESSKKDFTNFITNGFEIAVVQNEKKIAFGDLNQDGYQDFVAVLVNSNTNIEDADPEEVRIAIYEGSENDRYTQKSPKRKLNFCIYL